jgi:hypothetical protein
MAYRITYSVSGEEYNAGNENYPGRTERDTLTQIQVEVPQAKADEITRAVHSLLAGEVMEIRLGSGETIDRRSKN